MDIREIGAPGELLQHAQAADALFHSDRHFPFDWNGWGIGVEGIGVEGMNAEKQSQLPGESITAWRHGVLAILEDFDGSRSPRRS